MTIDRRDPTPTAVVMRLILVAAAVAVVACCICLVQLQHRTADLDHRLEQLHRTEVITRRLACLVADWSGYDGPPVRC